MNRCTPEEREASRKWFKENWKEVGEHGLECDGDWSLALKKFPRILDFMSCEKAARTKITQTSKKVSEQSLVLKKNEFMEPIYGWEKDFELFQWCKMQLESGVSIGVHTAHQQMQVIVGKSIDTSCWAGYYGRFIKRSGLVEDHSLLHTIDFTIAKCIVGRQLKKIKVEKLEPSDDVVVSKDAAVSTGGGKEGTPKLKALKVKVGPVKVEPVRWNL
jgi:hypothetical protein